MTSERVSSADRGPSCNVVALPLPPPQRGRRSRSSGRATATTSTGRSAERIPRYGAAEARYLDIPTREEYYSPLG